VSAPRDRSRGRGRVVTTSPDGANLASSPANTAGSGPAPSNTTVATRPPAFAAACHGSRHCRTVPSAAPDARAAPPGVNARASTRPE